MKLPAVRRLRSGLAVALISVAITACERESGGDRMPASAGANQAGFENLTFPGAPGSAQPRLAADVDGTPVLSWLAPVGDSTALRFARFGADTFGEIREVVRSDRMFVNGFDFPSVTPVTDELWFAHWLRLRQGGFTYDIATSLSTDGGRNWTEAEQMNDDDTDAEHGFVSAFPWNGEVAAFWLDGRELANWSFDEPDALLGVSLRLARYADDGSVRSREITDELVCDCCQVDVAIANSGPIVIYRDRTEDDIRDVVVRRRVDDAWTEPLNLGNEGWFIEGCPVNGPAIAARGDEVAAAWFTAADGMGRVRLALSHDGGASFTPPLDVDGNGALGQAAVVLDPDGTTLVGWWRRGAQGGIEYIVRAYDSDGTAGIEMPVTHESVGQPIDVPQLIAVEDGYLIAWTTLEGDGTVRLARLRRPR